MSDIGHYLLFSQNSRSNDEPLSKRTKLAKRK